VFAADDEVARAQCTGAIVFVKKPNSTFISRTGQPTSKYLYDQHTRSYVL
jgi:hypothetical protein